MNTDLDNLRAFRAADGAPDADARAAARTALLEQIEHAPAPWRTRRTAPRRRGRGLFAGGLGLAAAAAVAIALISGLGSGGVQPTDASAGQLLLRAADVAAQGPDPVLRPGQYWYTRSESTTRSTTVGDGRAFSVLLQMRREAWIGRDGGGRVRQYAVGAPRFLHPRDRASWIAAGRPDLWEGVMDVPLRNEDGTVPEKTYYLGAMALTYEQMRALPTDTDGLYALVAREAHENHNSHGGAHEMLTIVGDMLREVPAPPALRAALYRVAARIPGIELVGETTDAAGRSGVAVALGEPHERAELVFDAHTAALLGERDEMGGDPAFVSAYLESGVVDSTQTRP